MKVLIVNQGLSTNIGDKAILYAIKSYFINNGWQVDVKGFTHYINTELNDIDYVAYRQERRIDLPVYLKWKIKAKKRLLYEIKKIQDEFYDYVIIGGGQLIKSKCYFPYAMDIWMEYARKHSSKVVVLGVGSDTNLKRKECRIYKKALSKADNIIMRDLKSCHFIYDIMGVNSKVAPDTAFLLCNEDKNTLSKKRCGIAILPFDYDTYRYGLNNTLEKKEYRERWIKFIKKALCMNEMITLTYTTVEDKRETLKIAQYFNGETRVAVKEINSVDELIELFKTVNDVYSARMHALILGMVAGAKVHSINFSDKLYTFNKEYINTDKTVIDFYSEIKNLMNEVFK